MNPKIAIIGAGSLTFARALVHDLLSVPELQSASFSFMDISARNLKMVTKLVERDIQSNRLPTMLQSTTDRREAIAGADYVINVSRVGGLVAFEQDVEIPLQYGVDQCVGDTLGPGGIMYGQRYKVKAFNMSIVNDSLD